MHIQPVQTSNSNSINRPTRAPVAGSTMLQGIICIVAPSEAGEHVDSDRYLVFVKDLLLNTLNFVVLI